MIKFKMPTIERKGVIIKGGWSAFIPEVLPIAGDVTRYKNAFVKSGIPEGKVVDQLSSICQDVLCAGWVEKLRHSVAYYASVYYDMFGTLEGFDLRGFQEVWIPAQNFGRVGKKQVNAKLKQMYRASR